MINLPSNILDQTIAEVCQRWQIRKLALFGSVLRSDFRSNSDIDVLVAFEPTADWNAWDLLDLRVELGLLFGREIDLVEERSLENPFRRRAILRSQRVIYGTD
ncbi:MAG: nucleotidyltransferase domain-containing protein [Pirellulales bacterium]